MNIVSQERIKIESVPIFNRNKDVKTNADVLPALSEHSFGEQD